MRVAAKLPRSKITALRLAVANIHRPGALTPSVVLSLGLGLAVLVIVVQIDGNLRRQFQAGLARTLAGFLLRRHPEQRRRPLRRFHPQGRAGCDARTRADAARAHRRGERRQGRGAEADAAGRLGAAERPRHHLYRRTSRPVRAWSRASGGRPIIRARRCSRWRSGLRTASA